LHGNTSRAKTAKFIKYYLDRFRFYHFHDTSASADVKQSCDLHENRFLHANAGNLAAFLYMLREAHPKHYAQIRSAVRLVVPFFDDFITEPSRLNPNRVFLTWRETRNDYEFSAHQMSDGSLRFICLATLLLQPFDHPNAPEPLQLTSRSLDCILMPSLS
jgi:predicted ATPase